MRRLGPAGALALPPISPVEVFADTSGWTVTDRRPPIGLGVSQAPVASKAGRKLSQSPVIKKVKGTPGGSPLSARGIAGERDAPRNEEPELPKQPSIVLNEDLGPSSPAGVAQKQANVMKGRAIQNWLNHTLAQAGKPEGAISSTAAKQMQGLSQFGIDNAALEKLGLDATSAERVYRAMFVYSQGLHAVLQEAVGRAKSSSAALLVLWRAFTAVLEHAGQSEEKGESLAALVQRGNEEEKARIEASFKDQVTTLQNQTQKLLVQRRNAQEDVGRLREDEMRLRSESEMYRMEHEAAMSKYEKEIKLRVDAEVRYLDKTRHAERLEEDLDKEQKQCAFLSSRLKEEIALKETAQIELESARTQVKVLELQAQQYKQAVMEGQQAKQRHEQQVGQMKQQHDRLERKNLELKEQLEHEQDTVKRITEQGVNQQREIRRLERQGEDDNHIRKELQSERDVLREKLERVEKEFADLAEDRRILQKQLRDLDMEHRSKLLELKRKTELLDKTEGQLEKFQKEHSSLLDAHRVLCSEVDNLREDVRHLDSQCLKESDLRKQLQYEKKVLAGQLQTLQVQLDNSTLALQTTQKELQDVTEAKVKLEGVVRDTKSAMQKLNLEHQVQVKAHMQKVAMLEKVIADERNERRNLVAETQEVTAKREEAIDQIRKRDLEIRELRRQRLDKEEEADRYKVLLKAQQQRNSEQLIIIDKYHASVANHDAEMRQMQALLECERHEACRQLQELQDSYAAAKQTLEQRIEQWRFTFEDVLSRLNFNPATRKIHMLEGELEELKGVVAELRAAVSLEREKTARVAEALSSKNATIEQLMTRLTSAKVESENARGQVEKAVASLERQSMLRHDAEHQCERIRHNNEAYDDMKASLDAQLAEARATVQKLQVLLKKDVVDAQTQVVIDLCEQIQQTDLSYQYLESSARLNEDRGRRDRLTDLKKASVFVEDPDAARDFVSKEVCIAVPIAQIEMNFDRAKGAVATRLSVSQPRTSFVVQEGGRRRSQVSEAGAPAAPEPYPSAARAPSELLQVGQLPAQAVRRGSALPREEQLDASRQVSFNSAGRSEASTTGARSAR